MAEPALLDVAGLSVAYATSRGWLTALDNISLAIPQGGAVGLVGESGSGKSSVILALLGLLGTGAKLQATRMTFDGQDLSHRAASLRGRRIGVVFQDVAGALNPALTIGSQVAEPLLVHQHLSPAASWTRATELLAEMRIDRPAQIMRCYPHQLSGGMKQRVIIAAALATEPDLLLLDEPTTALDVTVEAQILDLLENLRQRRGLSMLLVSHNLGIVDRLCDHVTVLYAGRIAEHGATEAVLHQPRHPYTAGLLAALPRPDILRKARLSPIPGSLPDLVAPDPGCNFRPRCAFVSAGCDQPQSLSIGPHQASCHRAGTIKPAPPPAASPSKSRPDSPPLLQATHLSRRFSSRRFGRALASVQAVDEVSLTIHVGEIVGLVGESGCGKSTLGRLLLRLLPADMGSLTFAGATIGARPNAAFRRAAQIVFQNPDTSLNPRQTVRTILRRPLQRFAITQAASMSAEITRLLALVRLPAGYADRYPHQLSGGEKQRIGIARALASRPDFLVCDEAVSALDVSVQAAVLNLLRDIRNELGVAYLFISHDIGVIAHIADRIAVMYRGSLVEEGAVDDVLRPPYHPYTELLLRSVPIIGQRREPTPTPPDPSRDAAHSTGCKFTARCPRRLGSVCDTTAPPWQTVDRTHRIRCHIPLSILAAVPPWLPIHRVEYDASA